MNVIIADDHRLLRDSLSHMIEQNSNIKVIACASNGIEAYNYCEQYKPDLILMDIFMPVCNGLVATKLIKQSFPKVKVLILTASMSDIDISEALKNGADGYILKDIGKDELILSIESTVIGLGIIQREFLNFIKPVREEKNNGIRSSVEIDGIEISLSKRQQQILEMIVKGFDNRQISQALFIAEGTVKNNITEIISKFRLKDRTQLAVFAIKHSLV